MTIDVPGTGAPQIVLRTVAAPEAVAPIRHCFAGLGEELGFEPEQVANLKTIVSEACTNVVVHAYRNGDGPIEVSALFEDDVLEIRVRDFGRGIAPLADTDAETLRLGLSLIAALADGFELHASRDGGTEIRARLERAPGGEQIASVRAGSVSGPLKDGIQIAISHEEANTGALVHLVSATGAQADLPVDRLEEATLVAEALARAALDTVVDESHLRIAVELIEPGLRLRFGPIEPGAGDRLLGDLELPEIGSVAKLADSVEVQSVEGGRAEAIVLSFEGRSQ